jgi:arylsulfatase A-like enzyme
MDGYPPAMRPNIVFMITHDTGTRLGCYGGGGVTPNIDALAAQGVRLVNNFASAPQCSPSRGSILTGKAPHANGLMGLTNMGWDLPGSNRTLPSLLNEAGYTTRLIGHQHVRSTVLRSNRLQIWEKVLQACSTWRRPTAVLPGDGVYRDTQAVHNGKAEAPSAGGRHCTALLTRHNGCPRRHRALRRDAC